MPVLGAVIVLVTTLIAWRSWRTPGRDEVLAASAHAEEIAVVQAEHAVQIAQVVGLQAARPVVRLCGHACHGCGYAIFIVCISARSSLWSSRSSRGGVGGPPGLDEVLAAEAQAVQASQVAAGPTLPANNLLAAFGPARPSYSDTSMHIEGAARAAADKDNYIHPPVAPWIRRPRSRGRLLLGSLVNNFCESSGARYLRIPIPCLSSARS
jgi:hypothetical protein